jgi:hypothetical protein
MIGKAFEDAELWANPAGTCGLAALTCVEFSRVFGNKINSACKALLLPLLGASREELDEIKAWRDDARQDVVAWNSQIKNASDVVEGRWQQHLQQGDGGYSPADGKVF